MLQDASGYGGIVWFTGIPASGKTTLAFHIHDLSPLKTYVLDGDQVRKELSHDLGFSEDDRRKNTSRIGYVARTLAYNGIHALVASISPYESSRSLERAKAVSAGIPFIEVYVACSIETAIRRDPKGLYANAMKNGNSEVTGLNAPYEPPKAPEVIANTETDSLDVCALTVIDRMSSIYKR